jgi:hypothetical protein
MNSRLLPPCLVAALVAVTGCGGPDMTPVDQVEVNGTVSVPAGKIPVGVSITFQPTGGTSQPAVFRLKPDGTFAGKMNPGKYSYFLSCPEGNQKMEAAMKVLPETARRASLDRQIDVQGGSLQIGF